MQRYWWPGYETQLLGELQKQQNSTWFCDTLLQAEGISVPAHGCVLAALSPYLSQRLSASPSPPSGERRQLRLQAVKAETLLKLVGLLYSGEMAVKRGGEQDDVLAAARQFGIADLAEGPKDARTKDGELREKSRSPWSRRENGFHPEVDGRRRQESLQVQTETAGRKDETFKRRSRVSRSTQTVNVGGKSGRTKPPIPEAASSQSEEEFSVSLQPPNIPLDKQRSVTAFPTVPTDGDAAFTSVTNPTSTLSSGDSNSPRAEEENARREAPDSGGRVEATAEERTRPEDGGTNGGNAEEDGRVDGCEMSADERGKWTETRPTHACAGMKNMNSMKKMQQDTDTKTSVRMKLRRTTEGTEWEVVNAQDADETVSAINCLTEFFSDITGQFDPDEVRPPPFTVHMSPVQNPENPRPAPVRSPERTEHPNTTFDPPPPPLSNGCYPPDRSGEPEPAALGQPQGCAEETDEQMERLLEDIMIGLNILPGLETGREESRPSRDAAPTVCRVSENEAGRSRVNGVVGAAAGCLFFQDLEAPSGTSSTQTGTSRCFAAQNPAGHPDVAIQRQLLPPRYDPAVRPSVRSDGPSCRATPPSSSSRHPEAAAPRSVVASDFFPGGQKLYFPAFQQTSSRDDRYALQFLPLTETQPEHAVPSRCADDMRLPPCLSPLGSRASKRPPLPGNSTNPRSDFQQPPSLFRRPLLAENPGTLQFPLSAITENRSASSPRDANHRWRSKQRQEPNQTESFAAYGAEKRRTKSDTKKTKNSLKAEAPKRRKRRTKGSSQTRDGSILGRKDSKGDDGIKNFCPASLSSSNVPLKEREITSGSSVSESVAEKTGDLGTQRSRIGTRGLLKTSRGPASNSHSSVSTPVVCRAKIASEEGVVSLPKRKRGRPPKRKHEENRDDVPAVAGKKSHDVESDRRTKRRSRREEEKTPPEDVVKTERDDDDDDGASKRPRTASPEEFQKLVKRRHSNSRKPKESREADEAARDGGRRSKANGDETPEGSGEEPETDVDVEETGSGEGVDKHLRRLVETSAAEDGKSRRDETSSSSSWEDDRVEEERPMKTLDEGTSCAAAGSAAAAASNRVSLPRDPERPEPLRSATSGCDKEEEEEEEEEEEKEDEEEVDVMFYSPGNVPQTGKREDGLRHTDATADEDEEEVDVTGDEAE